MRRVCECPSDSFGTIEKGEKVYKIKTEQDIDTLTIEELEKFQYELNKILGHRFLCLLSIKDGCIELTFRGSTDDDFLIAEEQLFALRKVGVRSISYGSICLKIGETHSTSAPTEDEKLGNVKLIILFQWDRYNNGIQS